MHKDCASEYHTIKKVQQLYAEQISHTVVFLQLNKVIKDIVYNKHISADYLLFALRYAIRVHIPIKTPYGLYYIIDNNNIKEAYKQEIIKKKASIITHDIESDEHRMLNQTKEHSFNYTDDRQIGFSSIHQQGGKLNGSK